MNRKNRKAIPGLILLILALFLSGCVEPRRYQVQVTGYNPPGATVLPPPPAAFWVVTNPEAKDPDLEKEFKAKIEKLLGIKGYIITAFEQADYYLVFGYGQGPGGAVTVPMPVYGPRSYPYRGGYYLPYGFAPLPDYYPPGVQQLYDSWLVVNVIEGPRYRDKGEFQRIWQGEARSTGYSPNLRATINFLMVTLFEDFGKSTGRGRIVEVTEEDFRAQELWR
jgi:hypothetical protein